MYQERNVGDVTSANPFGGQGFSAGSMTALESDVSTRRLDWTGRHAFTARYAVQPVVDPILVTRWGPRHDQSVSYHLATVGSPTGLVYAYDRTWDEYAVLAIDVPRAAVETALGRALASDAHLTVEVFAGLLTDSLTAPTLSGCRIGEALAVHWEDVDLERQLVHIRSTLIRIPGQGLVTKSPKTKSGVRVLRISPWLVTLLHEQRARADMVGPVFPNSVGGYRERNNVESAFRRVRSDTEFEWVVPHTYRKTVATMLDQTGLSARTIADQLGHSRISMTQDVYMGRRAVDESAAAALEGFLASAKPCDVDTLSCLRYWEMGAIVSAK